MAVRPRTRGGQRSDGRSGCDEVMTTPPLLIAVAARLAPGETRAHRKNGPAWNRTTDLLCVRQALYQRELRARENHDPGGKISSIGADGSGRETPADEAGESLPEHVTCTDDDADHSHGAYARQ